LKIILSLNQIDLSLILNTKEIAVLKLMNCLKGIFSMKYLTMKKMIREEEEIYQANNRGKAMV
jgi:hypothetical protein